MEAEYRQTDEAHHADDRGIDDLSDDEFTAFVVEYVADLEKPFVKLLGRISDDSDLELTDQPLFTR